MKKGTRLSTTQRARCKPGVFTAARKAKVLELYAAGHSLIFVAKEVGVSRLAIFRLVARDKDFAKLFQQAKDSGTDHLADRLHGHAMGEEKITHPTAVTALFGILRARRPQEWRESFPVKLEAGDFATAFATAMQQATHGSSAKTADAGRTDSSVH